MTVQDSGKGMFEGGPLDGLIIPLPDPLPTVNDPSGWYEEIGRTEAGHTYFLWRERV